MTLKFQKIAVFVDVQNVFYTAKSIYHAKLDFNKLLEYIVNDRRLIRAMAYIVQSKDNDQAGFVSILNKIGYEVKSKILKIRNDGTAKGDWDMGLAIDAIAISSRVDVVALVSSDGDFTALVNHMKARGVKVEVYSFPSNTPDELKEAASEYIALGEDFLMPAKR